MTISVIINPNGCMENHIQCGDLFLRLAILTPSTISKI